MFASHHWEGITQYDEGDLIISFCMSRKVSLGTSLLPICAVPQLWAGSYGKGLRTGLSHLPFAGLLRSQVSTQPLDLERVVLGTGAGGGEA